MILSAVAFHKLTGLCDTDTLRDCFVGLEFHRKFCNRLYGLYRLYGLATYLAFSSYDGRDVSALALHFLLGVERIA